MTRLNVIYGFFVLIYGIAIFRFVEHFSTTHNLFQAWVFQYSDPVQWGLFPVATVLSFLWLQEVND